MEKFKGKTSKVGKAEKLVEKAFKKVARLLPEGRKGLNLDHSKPMDWVSRFGDVLHAGFAK